jgi:hypothetical protein
MSIIHLIGNSHTHTFSANPSHIESINPASGKLRCYHIGPVIAYNFYEHYLPIIKTEYLAKIDKDNDYICFIIGEVDCRIHLPQQADIQNRTDEDIVAECVSRFSRVYEALEGYKFIVFGTHPTTTEPHSMDRRERPIYSSMERRNNICVLWNRYMKELADNNGFPFISIYDYLVDENNCTKMEYFFDYCHLKADRVWPLVYAEFKKHNIEI